MRIRLLPVLMFAMVGTITIKVGAVWNAIEISVGAESLAQAQPVAQTAPADQPADPTAATQNASTQQPAASGQPSQPTDQAATQPAATTPTQPTTTPTQPAETTPTQPAEAGATGPTAPSSGDSTVSSDLGADEAAVPDPFDYTDEEVDVLQQLAKRREELDLRARHLDEREALVQAAEQRMDQKMAELKALQAMVEDLLKKRSDEQEAELKSLVKMYENMKPKDAAQVFEEMDMDVLLDVVARMNERKAAPILALVTPTLAKEITFELAQRRVLPVPE